VFVVSRGFRPPKRRTGFGEFRKESGHYAIPPQQLRIKRNCCYSEKSQQDAGAPSGAFDNQKRYWERCLPGGSFSVQEYADVPVVISVAATGRASGFSI